MKSKEMLQQEIEICDLHAARIKMAFKHMKQQIPLTTDRLQHLSDEQLGFLELITSRFAKLQDAIGQKVFPLTLELLQEDIEGKSFLDRLNMLEKLGLLNSVQYWITLREIRNSIAHDYPENPELMVSNLNKAIDSALGLLEFWGKLKKSVVVRF